MDVWRRNWTPLEVLALVLVARWVMRSWAALRREVLRYGLKAVVLRTAFRLVKRLPMIQRKIKEENEATIASMEESLLKETATMAKTQTLPKKGMPSKVLLEQLQEWNARETAQWSAGKSSSAVYHGGKDLSALTGRVFELFASANQLYPDVFPYARKMEAEVISMCVNLFHGSDDACGSMTNGGTESILLAVKTVRDWARSERGITEPEMIVASSAHAAFDKAAHYFGVHYIQVPVDSNSFKLTLEHVKPYISRNTALIVVSAPSFPQGVIDDVESIAGFAKMRNIAVHVDCCLGGLLLPFIPKLGMEGLHLPRFDFAVPGVTSISADTHKYGYAPKGSSVVLYSSKTMRRFQYHVSPDWSGGIYATPAFGGTRSGAMCACTWATMVHLGEEGYLASARLVMEAAVKVKQGVMEIPELVMLGDPLMSVIAFDVVPTAGFNVYQVAEAMAKRGWGLNSLQNPRSVHICCTYTFRGKGDEFVGDLKESIRDVQLDPESYTSGSVAMYGMVESVPDQALVGDLAALYLDTLTKV